MAFPSHISHLMKNLSIPWYYIMSASSPPPHFPFLSFQSYPTCMESFHQIIISCGFIPLHISHPTKKIFPFHDTTCSSLPHPPPPLFHSCPPNHIPTCMESVFSSTPPPYPTRLPTHAHLTFTEQGLSGLLGDRRGSQGERSGVLLSTRGSFIL